VITKSRPTKTEISPVSTTSTSAAGDSGCTYRTVLSTANSVSSYRSSLGRWCSA
jgi:hypothetical protein